MLAPPAAANFPAKASPLFRPAHYKVMHGGRGGGKSWAAARALLILANRKKLFILCAREIQRSISESVYKLLIDQIDALGMAHLYDVKSNSITHLETGSRFVFAGVRNNITAIKSMESVDICWLEEAEKVSGHSWSVLLPTIRRDPPFGPFGRGSEVWIVFNPELDSDFTYKFWVLDPPKPVYRYEIINGDWMSGLEEIASLKPETVLMEMNYRDNEWFSETLRRQMLDMRRRDYEDYLTIFEGKVRRIVKGAIFAREIEKAMTDKRIGPHVVLDRSKPVDIAVDLGRADMTVLWFVQQVGMEHRFIDYYGNFGFDWSHYLEQIQSRKYLIGRIYLPHDAKAKGIAAKKSVYQQTQDLYPNPGQVLVVPVTSKKANDINATRLLFPRMCFNEMACSDGLHALAHYRYEVDPEDARDVSNEPLHDWASHTADSLFSYVMGLRFEQRRGPQMHIPPDLPQGEHAQGWMAL